MDSNNDNNNNSNKPNYNEDELHAPDWLNEEFFEKVLRNSYDQRSNSIKILKSQITPATAKNDHYGSVMFRAVVDYHSDTAKECQRKSLIIKTLPMIDGQKKDLLGDTSIFETEIGMYSRALPKIEGILRKYGDNTILRTKTLYHSLSPPKLIVFEDLVEKGYSTTNRATTMDESKMILLKLAKLHAVGYMLGKQDDNTITSFCQGTFSMRHILEMELIAGATKSFKEVLSKFEDLKSYIPYVEKIEGDLIEKCIETFTTYRNDHPEGIYVLNHGDVHLKNMMFKRKANGELDDIMMLDYQMSFFGPVVVDVLYTIFMLMSRELRSNHREELLYYYFSNFQDALKMIEYKGEIPTMIDFQMELIRHRHWEMFLFIGFLPMVAILTDSEGDITQTVENAEYRKNWLMNPNFIDEIREQLPKYLHRGYFD